MPSFTLRTHILDPVEQSLYRALTLVICQRALIFVKLNLSDLFTVSPYTTANDDLPQLAHCQVDFVLCDRETIRPLAVILLETADAPGLDDTADKCAQFCTTAGLPVIRLQRQNSYFISSLTTIIEPLFAGDLAEDDFHQDHRCIDAPVATVPHTLRHVRQPRKPRRRPAYPGYGALRAIANKLS